MSSKQTHFLNKNHSFEDNNNPNPLHINSSIAILINEQNTVIHPPIIDILGRIQLKILKQISIIMQKGTIAFLTNMKISTWPLINKKKK